MAQKWKFRYQMYKHLQVNMQSIFAEARQRGEEIGITPEMHGKLGLTGAISACHGSLRREVAQAMDEAAFTPVSSATLDEGIREVVKEVYGDGYDAALVSTCEAGLMISFDVLCMPPQMGRGDPYRGRYIAFYERFMHHPGAYGRPFPPKYKEYLAEQGETSGEYGIQGKRAANLDTLVVRMAGADYTAHGIKYHPAPNLLHVDGKATVQRVAETAALHSDSLVGLTSLAYDTPGYGYGDKMSDGTPVIQHGLAHLAEKYDIPYIVDNAWGAPFIGADIRKLGADVMIYSMDKVTGSPTCGLMIGKEEAMVQIRRAVGIHGARYGSLSSHGKAAYVGMDPGKEALIGALTALRILKDRPVIAQESCNQLYELVLDEFAQLPEALREGWTFCKSPNSLAVEMTYNDTWQDGRFGIPIFTVEDMYAGTNLIQFGLSQMGLMPTITFDGNIWVSNGLGNVDEDGRLLEVPTRLALRGLFKMIEIVSRYAGLLD
ncbi:MAG: hypothetical protein LLG42_10085 [Chloroflexi bacterium]|nr:hypothetical protein [Chloroflexota bacterium]